MKLFKVDQDLLGLMWLRGGAELPPDVPQFGRNRPKHTVALLLGDHFVMLSSQFG